MLLVNEWLSGLHVEGVRVKQQGKVLQAALSHHACALHVPKLLLAR